MQTTQEGEKAAIRVAITGAAGNIGYALLWRMLVVIALEIINP